MGAFFKRNWIFLLLLTLPGLAYYYSRPLCVTPERPATAAVAASSGPGTKAAAKDAPRTLPPDAAPARTVETGESSAGVYIPFLVLLASISAAVILLRNIGKLKKVEGIPRPDWGLFDVLFTASLFIFQQEVLMWAFKYYPVKSYANLMLFQSLAWLMTVLFILVLTREKSGERDCRPLGLTFKRPLKSIALAATLYLAALIPLYLAYNATYKIIRLLYPGQQSKIETQVVIKMVTSESTTLGLLVLGITICLIAPIAEELLFRGFLYPVLKKYLGMIGAALVTSAAFAVSHQPPLVWGTIFLLALLLTYVYEKTGSLYSAIFIHILHNTTIFALLRLTTAVPA